MDLDPHLWPNLKNYKVIWLDEREAYFTIVDVEDYDDLIRWKWCVYNYRGKLYARRTKLATDNWKLPWTIYMHRYLAEKHLYKPSKLHYIVDHKHGNGLDNRKSMIRWATVSENRKNAFGRWWQSKAFLKQLNSE